MRFERYGSPTARAVSDGGFSVYADLEDAIYIRPGEVFRGRLGFVGNQGTIRASSPAIAPRDWRQRATHYLERARTELQRRGDIPNPQLDRRRREEQETGSFIVELDDGRVGRFHSLHSENRTERGNRLYRPGAADWAEAELESGRARHADVFRGPISAPYQRPRIYAPDILPAREGHRALVVGEIEHLPIASWTVDAYGRVGTGASVTPPSIRSAYGLKAHAMRLVDDRELSGIDLVGAPEIATAWRATAEAFAEAGLPLQERFARDNAAFWFARTHEATELLARQLLADANAHFNRVLVAYAQSFETAKPEPYIEIVNRELTAAGDDWSVAGDALEEIGWSDAAARSRELAMRAADRDVEYVQQLFFTLGSNGEVRPG